jgi:hypothetical protein
VAFTNCSVRAKQWALRQQRAKGLWIHGSLNNKRPEFLFKFYLLVCNQNQPPNVTMWWVVQRIDTRFQNMGACDLFRVGKRGGHDSCTPVPDDSFRYCMMAATGPVNVNGPHHHPAHVLPSSIHVSDVYAHPCQDPDALLPSDQHLRWKMQCLKWHKKVVDKRAIRVAYFVMSRMGHMSWTHGL